MAPAAYVKSVNSSFTFQDKRVAQGRSPLVVVCRDIQPRASLILHNSFKTHSYADCVLSLPVDVAVDVLWPIEDGCEFGVCDRQF